jgi:hypothetical protein
MENLTTILKDTLTVYTGIGFRNYGFPVFDDAHQTYSVNVVDYATEIFEERAGIVFLCRLWAIKS